MMIQGLIGFGIIGGVLAFSRDQHSDEGRRELWLATQKLELFWTKGHCSERAKILNEATFHLGKARVHSRATGRSPQGDRQLKIGMQKTWRLWDDTKNEFIKRCVKKS